MWSYFQHDVFRTLFSKKEIRIFFLTHHNALGGVHSENFKITLKQCPQIWKCTCVEAFPCTWKKSNTKWLISKGIGDSPSHKRHCMSHVNTHLIIIVSSHNVRYGLKVKDMLYYNMRVLDQWHTNYVIC